MKHLTYYSEFDSCAPFNKSKSARYRIEIYGDAQVIAKEVTLAGESTATIEWSEVSKVDPIQGSSLTLRLISESDREFTHLYSVADGVWRVDVKRNGILYWRGWIDPELYEEPYSTASGYEVEVTASDFGAMERTDFSLSGTQSLKAVLDHCLQSCGLDDLQRVLSVSTKRDETTALNLEEVYIACENFYDEDGKPMTCREVAEGVLKPFGLRMLQRGGKLIIFDLNAAYSDWASEEVFWSSDDSTLGVDKTYNKVVVKLSTYSDATGCNGEADVSEAKFTQQEGKETFLVDPDWKGEKLTGFTLDYGYGTTPTLATTGDCRLGVFNAEYSGSDTVAAIWQFKGGGNVPDTTNKIVHVGGGTHIQWDLINPKTGDHGDHTFTPIIRIKGKGMRVVGYESPDGRYGASQKLKVSLELLLDTRYNPYEGEMKDLNEVAVQVCVPARLTLFQEVNGVMTPKYFYSNYTPGTNDGKLTNTGEGKWLSVANNSQRYNNMELWLSYYSWNDFRTKAGVGGWATNKKTIHDLANLSKADERRGDGEFVPLPPASGYLQLEIGRGFAMRDRTYWYSDLASEYCSENSVTWGITPAGSILNRLRWLAYRSPKVELVKSNGLETEQEDLQDSAWITPTAAEELAIDTIVGTPGGWSLPTSKAVIMDAEGNAIKHMYRAGVTDRIERLMIGSVYSQYAQRRVILSGTCELLPGLCTLTDASDPDGRYIMLGEIQNLATEESEIVMAQYGADDYKGLEITTESDE